MAGKFERVKLCDPPAAISAEWLLFFTMFLAIAFVTSACVTKGEATGEIAARFGELRRAHAQPLEKRVGLLEQSAAQLSSRFEANRKSLAGLEKRLTRAKEEAGAAGRTIVAMKTAFDEQLAAMEKQVRAKIAQSDPELYEKTLAEMRMQESEFPAYYRLCALVLDETRTLQAKQTKTISVFSAESRDVAAALGANEDELIGGSTLKIPPLHKRRIDFDIPENVNSWMALSELLIRKNLLKPVPPEVERLLALDSATLDRRESEAHTEREKFLLRAMRNYKRGLEQLAKETKVLPRQWEPVWDGEKSLIRYSGDRPAPRRWMEKEAFRTALINKAYVYDTLIRMRGGKTDTYDRFEMAHYLSEMIWCARKLGHPFGDEIEQLVNDYILGLKERRALTER